MLQTHVLPELRKHRATKASYYQQDGARPHISRAVINFLSQTFGHRLVSLNSDNTWPPYSPDLTPMDFWCWSYLMDAVYSAGQPQTIDELKLRISSAALEIPRHLREEVFKNMITRCHACILVDGSYFENML